MKTRNWQTMVAALAVAGLTMSGSTVLAQNANGASPAVVSSATPPLSDGAQEILQLEQAKVNDDTVIAFVNGSANNFALSADQIVYLRQQGVPNPVIMAMLHKSGPVTYAPASVPPTAPTTANTAVVPPADTTAQTAPSTVYYYDDTPYYYSDDYPYYYGAYPTIGLGWGWYGGFGWHPGGWHDGGGWHGSGGGYHGGGGFSGHGGGGFHGGGGDRHH